LPSTEHPLFGNFTKKFVGSPLWGVSLTEHQLYLGWTVILLAFVAFRKWRRRCSNINEENFWIGFFVFLVIVAWLFSQPPWWRIGPIKIFMPSFFMYKILPMVRAYCRFGIVVELGLSILAGFGLNLILDRIKNKNRQLLLGSIFCFLVLFEFWNWPPYKVIDVSKAPQVYYWLKNQPQDFAIAEYPLDTEGPNEMYKFYQIFHQKPIINGTIPGTYANKVAQKIVKLSDPKTASILKWMGVKYVLVHKEDYLKTELVEWIEELKRIPQNPYLKFIKSFPPQECPSQIMCTQKTGPIDVYEITTESIEPSINN